MAKHDDTFASDSLQELFASNSEGDLRKMVEIVLNTIMSGEVAQHLNADRYERTDGRSGHRNGTKARTLNTRVGRLNLEVPQVRGCEPYHPTAFARYQRSERALLSTCSEMYFQGVSTRRVNKVIETMCGSGVSAAQVSRLNQELDEHLSAFRARRLDISEYVYLIIDARYEHIRVNGRVVSQAVLVTAGVSISGRREILDWRVADSESEASWSEVFRSLKDRGLRGVEMVVSDAHRGIRKALERHLQGVAWQRCRVHFKRNLLSAAGNRWYKEVISDIRAVFAPEERNECLRRAEEMAAKWEGIKPKVAALLRDGFESCLTVCGLSPFTRGRLNSTNMLERLMRELKRRSRVVGIFPNAASCDRLMGCRLLEMYEQWQLEEVPYIPMSDRKVGELDPAT